MQPQDEQAPPPRAAVVARKATRAFEDQFGLPDDSSTAVGARAPGRVNLLGGHTDYSGGFVLPAPIDRTVCVLFRRRTDEAVRLWSVDFEERATGSLANLNVEALPGWARYVAGVAATLREEGYEVRGFEGVICGDVPRGAGLSSSAALEVAVALGLDGLFSLGLDPVETARLCQYAEQTYAGVDCGILDQFAARLGRSGHALFLDCRSLAYEHVPLPAERACPVVLDTRVSRSLADSKYNERRRECEEATRFFRQFDECVTSLRDVPVERFEKHGNALPTTIRRRARHVIHENRRVEDGAEALRQERLDRFGDLMNASHASLSGDYAVSCAELDALAATAQETEGVFGAHMVGGGFGGCVVALAAPEAVGTLREHATAAYEEQFGHAPDVYAISRGAEAGLLEQAWET